MYDLDVQRLLNFTYAAILDGSPGRRDEARDRLEAILRRASEVRRPGADRRGRGMSVTKAQQVAREMAQWDARAAKGQVED